MSEIPRIRSPSQVWAGIHAHDAAGPSGGSTGPSRPDDHLVNLVVVHQDLKVDLGTRVLRAPRTSV